MLSRFLIKWDTLLSGFPVPTVVAFLASVRDGGPCYVTQLCYLGRLYLYYNSGMSLATVCARAN